MGELFNKLCSRATLESAWQSVIKKNARGGLDGVQPKDLETDFERTISTLMKDLHEQKYVPVPYEKGAMPKFNEENEWRSLSLPAVIDKIVQQAFKDTVGLIFEKEFLDCSYAYRQGKGPVRAIKRIEHILRSYPIRWMVTMDIDNFFDTMNHDLLSDAIAKRLSEPEIIKLVSLWLHAGVVSASGEWDEPDEGIAQGSIVSPLFSNIYLHGLDKFAVQKQYHYLRYSDNFILLSEKKDSLYIAYEEVQSFLETQLKLKLNANPYPFKAVDRGFAFLGIYFRGDLRRISSAKETKIFRKLNWLTDKSRQRDHNVFLERLNESVEGAKRYYSFIEPSEQFESFDQHMLKRLKSLLLNFLQRGLFSSRDELLSALLKVRFFTDRPQDKHKAICQTLADEVYNTIEKDSGKSETTKEPQPSQSKRIAAQKARYLRKVSNQAEMIVSTPGIFIGKTSGRFIIREKRQNVLEVPFSKIRNLSINSNGVSLSSDVVFQCSQSKIPISFYTFSGMPYSVLQTPMHSLGTVSVLQIKAYETAKALGLVKKLITGKSKNQTNLLKFYLRSRKKSYPAFSVKVYENLEKMKLILKDLQKIRSNGAYSVARDHLFSVEGRISALYWDCMKMLISPELGFEKRQRFQAPDLVNNMLNYGYGILYQRVWQAVLKAGLNPHISFLHAFQANKPTLVYDLVEEHRQPFVDRPIFSLLTRGKKGADLKMDQKTGFLSKETKDQVIKAVLNRLSGLISFRDKKIKCEDIIIIQARNLVSFLEDKKDYKPFIAGY